jgi:hypothetical protein
MPKSTHRKTLSKLQNIPAHLQWNSDRIANESLSVATISHQRLETPTSSIGGTYGSPQQIQTPIAHIDYFDIKTSQYALWGQDDGVPTSKGKETGGSKLSISFKATSEKDASVLKDLRLHQVELLDGVPQVPTEDTPATSSVSQNEKIAGVSSVINNGDADPEGDPKVPTGGTYGAPSNKETTTGPKIPPLGAGIWTVGILQ